MALKRRQRRTRKTAKMKAVEAPLVGDEKLSSLLDLARLAYRAAQASAEAHDVTIARLLNAAWLMQRRRQTGTLDRGAAELGQLDRSVAAYTDTRQEDERWVFAGLPPLPYMRANAVKLLCDQAAKGQIAVKSTHARHVKDMAQLVAKSLISDAIALGLSVGGGRTRHSKEEALLATKLEMGGPDYLLAAQVLRAAGVSRTDAANWTRATLTVGASTQVKDKIT